MVDGRCTRFTEMRMGLLIELWVILILRSIHMITIKLGWYELLVVDRRTVEPIYKC
jgi:hypothetical protein